jgi:hypothetical protein
VKERADLTTLLETLVARERDFWDASSAGDGDFYRANVTEGGVFVFPPPTGAIDRDTCATIVDGNETPWQSYQIYEARLVPLAMGVAVITYRATAQPEGGNRFAMLVSSAYVRRDENWLLAFHQQTFARDGA